ncbi:unnamed protein product [Pleuronectes platessa]|uniref:Uncharacterized protein n=1 Tax=Pleuronectes platessa TaxID=8262 RepID=A0A9N7VMH8_PLEPL|nr:unnamed protein product [Pleuronectes platessa]
MQEVELPSCTETLSKGVEVEVEDGPEAHQFEDARLSPVEEAQCVSVEVEGESRASFYKSGQITEQEQGCVFRWPIQLYCSICHCQYSWLSSSHSQEDAGSGEHAPATPLNSSAQPTSALRQAYRVPQEERALFIHPA